MLEWRPSNFVAYSNGWDWGHDSLCGDDIYGVYYPMWERLEEWKHDAPVGMMKLQLLMGKARGNANRRLHAPKTGPNYRRAKREWKKLHHRSHRKYDHKVLFEHDSDSDPDLHSELDPDTDTDEELEKEKMIN